MSSLFSVAKGRPQFREVRLPALDCDPAEANRLAVQGTMSESALGVAILGILLGYEDDAMSVLHRFRPWLETAVSEEQWRRMKKGSPADQARWHEAQALINWLTGSVQSDTALRYAIDYWLDWYATSQGKQFRGEMGALFALAVDAGRCEEIVALYGRPLTRPLKPTSATSDAGFGNYLAHRLLESGKLAEADERAFDRFLQANMHKNWLSRGQFQTAAHWLKLRFWNFADPKPEPFAVVRRALNYIPEEARQ